MTFNKKIKAPKPGEIKVIINNDGDLEEKVYPVEKIAEIAEAL